MSIFTIDRSKGIGGSDVGGIFNIAPYGCERRVWYYKRNAQPEIETHKAVFDRGILLEPIIAKMFETQTGLKTRKVNKPFFLPHHQHIFAHIDRLIVKSRSKPAGVLEIKTMGQFEYKKLLKTGLPDNYILQMQHYLMVTGLTWGAFAILWADGWQFHAFEVQRDKDLIDKIFEQEQIFWRKVEYGQAPDRLDPSDKRCQNCEFRNQCQGEILLKLAQVQDNEQGEWCSIEDALDKELQEYKERLDIFKQAEELLEEQKEKVKALVGDRTNLKNEKFKIYYKPVTQERFDTTKFKKEHPDLANKYLKQTVSRPLKITIIGEQ